MCWPNAFLHGGNSDVISLHQLETKRKIFFLLKVNSKISNFKIQGCEPLPELWLHCLCPQGIRCFTRTATFPIIGIGQGRATLFSLRAEISSMTRFFCALTKISKGPPTSLILLWGGWSFLWVAKWWGVWILGPWGSVTSLIGGYWVQLIQLCL